MFLYHSDSYSCWTLLHSLDPRTHVKIYLKRRESSKRKYQQEFYQFYQFLAEILNKALMDSRIQTFNWYEQIHKLGKYSKSAKTFCRKSKINLLINPKNVPEIINLLERRFGLPEVIINNLIISVKMRPPTKDYKRDT